MHLNHIDLPVTDIAAARAFFERHFGFACVFERDDGLAVLLDRQDFALTLSGLEPDDEPAFPRGFHVGFNLETEAELMETLERLTDAGVPLARPLGDLGGAQTFQVLAPGDVLVEIAWRPRG